MISIIDWLAAFFDSTPMPLLEVWGRLAYFVGIALAISAFGGFTFRPGGHLGIGRERQAWDSKAVLSIPLTFILIIATGYVGSFIVLVPGAQTFESLKDLVVFLCIALFGYPALITVPFAYGLSDLIEGVPPDFLLDWLPGYFINPACFWIAYQLFGKNPDFRRLRTWGKYLAFVVLFMAIEPVLWGYICAGKFTSLISYRNITPALFFTTGITWIIAPIAMLVAYPLARKAGIFWAEIPMHVKERRLGSKEWIWESSGGKARPDVFAMTEGWPIRVIILAPFIALVLLMVAVTAYVTLRSAEVDANKLATRLHQEVSDNIKLRLDEYLARAPTDGMNAAGISDLLKSLPVSQNGFALLADSSGRTVASSVSDGHPIGAQALSGLKETPSTPAQLEAGLQFSFDYIVAKPLSRETWLARATAYHDRRRADTHWIVVTGMPQSYYLAGVQAGNSRSAMIFALALLLSLSVAAVLAATVTDRLRQISLATQALANGDLSQRVPGSRMEELGALAQSFNGMAEQLQASFDEIRTSENRLQLALRAGNLAIWDWDVEKDLLVWDESMYQLYGVRKEEFGGAYEAWISCLAPEDFARATGDVEAALRGDRNFASEFRIQLKDGSMRFIRGVAQTIRDNTGKPLRMVGINWDVTEERIAEQTKRELTHALGERVKELTCLHRAAKILQDDRLTTADWLRELTLILPPGWQYPEDTAARISLGEIEFASPAFARTPWLQSTEFIDASGARGVIEVAYLIKKPAEAEGPFLAEERNLIDSLAEMLCSALDRRHAEDERNTAVDHLRRSEERFQIVARATNDAIWDWDLTTQTVWWNQAIATLFNYSAEDVAASEVSGYRHIHPDDRERVISGIQHLMDSGAQVWSAEYRFRRADGSYADVVDRAFVIYGADRTPLRMIGAVTDITERKRAMEVLEQRVETRTTQLRRKNEELKAFAYTVSHDLKAPLRGIAGYAQELDRRHREGLADRALFCIRQITTATQNLDRLIDDLLHYSRLETEVPTGAEVDLRQVVDRILKDRRLVIVEQNAEIVITLSLTTIRTWERGLSQVLTNLIDNALKYSRNARPPRIQIASHELADTFQIVISDNGIGFDMKYHDRIFGLFNRLVRQEEFEGTGAGLAIVKKVVEKMGGRIWAEAKPGSGARFFVELPKVHSARTEAT